MPRGFSVAQKAALAARVVKFCYLVDLDLPAGHVRVWNGAGTLTALAQTWQGLGEYGAIEGLESDRTLKARGISLTLHSIPGDLITPGIVADTRSVRYQGRPITVYMGVQNTATDAIIDSPLPVWDGFADVLTFRLGTSISATLTAEHYESHMRRTNGLRMTTESHNTRLGNPSPRDLFFDAQDRLMARPRATL